MTEDETRQTYSELMEQAAAYAEKIGKTFVAHHEQDNVSATVVVLALVYLAAAGDCDMAPERPDEAERFAAMTGAVHGAVRRIHTELGRHKAQQS